jgi:hypothetical protein
MRIQDINCESIDNKYKLSSFGDKTQRIFKKNIPLSFGGGLLNMAYTTIISTGEITRFSMAYVNLEIFKKDNGRVVGYDNSHGGPHKHWFGEIIQLSSDTSYFTILNQFKQEVGEILVNYKVNGINNMKESQNITLDNCPEFNDFFKEAESIIKKAEEYRLEQQKNKELLENNIKNSNRRDLGDGRSEIS